MKICLVSSYKEQTLSFKEFLKDLEIIRKRNCKKFYELIRNFAIRSLFLNIFLSALNVNDSLKCFIQFYIII